MYKSWFFGAGFYARVVFTCSVCIFFSTSFNKNRFLKKRKWKIFNQLMNNFCTKTLRTYCLLSEDYVNLPWKLSQLIYKAALVYF